MNEKIQNRLDRVAELVPLLNETCDQVSLVIREVNQKLSELKIGITSVGSCYRSGLEEIEGSLERDFCQSSLRYGRMASVMSIHVIREWKSGDVVLHRRFVDWSTLSRGEKIESIFGLESLLRSIEENAKKQSSQAERAMEYLGFNSDILTLRQQLGG